MSLFIKVRQRYDNEFLYTKHHGNVINVHSCSYELQRIDSIIYVVTNQ